MGNHESLLQDIQIYRPPFQDLVLKDPGNQFKIYQHRFSKVEVMAHKVTLNQEKQLPILIEYFKARYQHHYLVSTLYLACEDYSKCGGYYQSVIFYQRVFTNLSKIKDIPFPDVLHFYAVALKGFQILFFKFGYFQIYEDMFHLGQDSKMKVWCNKDISKNQPEPYLIDKNGTEEDMIRKIIFIIDENTDHFTERIRMKDRILSYGVRNFQMAHQSLRQICRQNNLSVPQRVQCITSLPSQQVQNMLDLYTVNNKLTHTQVNRAIDDLILRNDNQNGNQMLKTPFFPKNEATHTPVTQQFKLYEGVNSIPGLNISHIQGKSNQQSMIHTFNKRHQIPPIHNRHGIDLSLLKNRQQKNSKHSQNTRNKSLPEKSNSRFIVYNNINQSLQKGNNIKINFVSQNPLNYQYQNVGQRFAKQIPSQDVNFRIEKKVSPQILQNYPVYQGFLNNHPQSVSRVNYVPESIQRYNSQPIINQNVNHHPIKSSIVQWIPQQSQQLQKSALLQTGNNLFRNESNKYKAHSPNVVIWNNQTPRIIQKHQSLNKPTFSQNLNIQQQFPFQVRNRRRSSDHSIKNHLRKSSHQEKTNNNNTNYFQQKKSAQNTQVSHFPYNQTPHQTTNINKDQTRLFKTTLNPFQIIQENIRFENSKQNNNSNNNLHLQVPMDKTYCSQFNAHSASSRYLHSNRQLNGNIPDLKYKNPSPKKNISKLLDTNILELQSFNQSKFGTQNSFQQRNSRVLQIIGRQKKDSVTSAFQNQQKFKNDDFVKQFQPYEYSANKNNLYKGGDSFTNPKILQILKRPSSNALKKEINNLKKVSKTNKNYDFTQLIKKPVMNNDVKADLLKYSKNKAQQNYTFSNAPKENLIQYQGFPSLSNISQIKNSEEMSFNQQKVNNTLNNVKSSNKRSRFSEEKLTINKQQNVVSEFYQFQYQSPKYEYSFAGKRQVPIQDNQWKAQYGTTSNELKDQSISTLSKTKDFKAVPQKPFNFLTGFNSNQSLASLQFQLSKKQMTLSNQKDKIKQSFEKSKYTDKQTQSTLNTQKRKYNPRLDPQISKDLQKFRQKNSQIRIKE